MAITTGIFTGLLGYTLKKEFLGDTVYYRETEVFNYDLYSLDFSGFSPTTIQNTIISEFSSKYSGDINVKVFQVPADYYFPNDSVRLAKYNVQVEVKKAPIARISGAQPELTGSYYKGLDSSFFSTYAPILIDFREDFNFEQLENGNKGFSHNVSFSLLSGGRPKAQEIITGIYSHDKDTNFGITTFVGGAVVADSGTYQNFYTEVYDVARNTFNFTRKRELLALSGASYTYDFNHVFDLKEDGIADITEKGTVRGNMTYDQAFAGATSLISTAYTRCNAFYQTYRDFIDGVVPASQLPLVNFPTRISKVLNKSSLLVTYDATYTNNPQFHSDGTSTEESISINQDEKSLVEIKHDLVFTTNKRSSPSTALMDAINSAVSSSPSHMTSIYNGLYPSLPFLKQINYTLTWPTRKPRAEANFSYSNHPKYLATIPGFGGTFRFLETRINNTIPNDILTEYKVINRPTKKSVLNYAYQTDKGQYIITFDAGIGRIPDEFLNGFRTDVPYWLIPLYKYGILKFMQQFQGLQTLAFTYYMSDVKFTLNNDGGLQLTLTFPYTLKKYTI